MKDTNDTIPLDAVNQLIRLDTDAPVSRPGLALLAERVEPEVAKPSIEAALNDSAPEVRKPAQSLMADLGLAEESPDELRDGPPACTTLCAVCRRARS